MPSIENIDLAKYRLQKARNCLVESKNDISEESYESSANRSYYAMFHAARAVLALESLDFKKHSSVIARFRELYIKTNNLPVEMSDAIGNAFTVRGNADYADFFVISKEEVQTQLDNASKFVENAMKYIESRIEKADALNND